MPPYSQKTVAVLLMFVSVSLFAAISLAGKSLGTGAVGPVLHPVQITTARFGFALAIITVFFLSKRPGFQSVPWSLHLARGVCGWMGITCMFIAATKIPLADANAISFMSVIITMGLSIPLLGEKVGPRRWTAASIAFLGALVLIQPGTDAFHPAALIALAAAFFIGFEAIFVKQLSEKEEPVRILFINNAIGAVISAAVVVFFWVMPTLQQWILLAAIGSIMVVIQTCFIQAVRRMDASFVTPFWYAVPLFAALYDWTLFDQHLSTISIVGIFLITLGGVIICRRS